MPPTDPAGGPQVTIGAVTPPADVLDYFRAKKLTPRFSWLDVWGKEHAFAFTVAKATETEVIKAFRSTIDDAIAQGMNFREWRAALKPQLAALGWWGRHDVVDPQTGKTASVDFSSPRRLRTTFWSNMRAARAAGQWERAQATKETLPYLLYVHTTSAQPRPRHLAWVGTVLPIDHPFWSTHYPPNAWGCKCAVRQIGRAEAAKRGVSPDPVVITRPFRNRRTGEVTDIPDGIDPGWHRNPGADRAAGIIPVTPPAARKPRPKPKPKPKPEDTFTFVSAANIGGTKVKEFWDDGLGRRWLFKPAQADGPFIPYAEQAASEIGRAVNPDAVMVKAKTLGGKWGSIQRYEAGTQELAAVAAEPAALAPHQVAQLQREHVVDWAIGNHDSHVGNFIVKKTSGIVGVDKGQAWKYFPRDKLAVDYHPNAKYDEKEPYYNALWRAARDGHITVDLAPTYDAIAKLQAIPDAHYRAIVRPYAEARFMGDKAQVKQFLDHAVARKASLKADFDAFLARLKLGDHVRQGSTRTMVAPKTTAQWAPVAEQEAVRLQHAAFTVVERDLVGTERSARSSYIGGGYLSWNAALRAAGAGPVPARYRAATEALDRALAARTLPEDMLLVRDTGYADGFSSIELALRRKGTVINDPAYFSSTARRGGAGFGGHAARPPAPAVRFYVRAKKGMPAIAGHDDREREFVFPRKTRWHVLDVQAIRDDLVHVLLEPA